MRFARARPPHRVLLPDRHGRRQSPQAGAPRAAVRRRPRRCPRDRGRRGAALPRRRVDRARRLPRRRHVLRPLRLPDHLAADHRARGHRPDRPVPVLAPARAAAAAGRVPGHRGHRAGGGDLPARRRRADARRRDRLLLLRQQLAPGPGAAVLLRDVPAPVAAAAPVVARRRGAVLPAVAARPRLLHEQARPHADGAAHARARGRVGDRDGRSSSTPARTPRASTSAPTRTRPGC